MSARNLCAVYDFELMPYALGDVLTWNVQTAIRCEELGRERVDVFICLDERQPSNIYQRDVVVAENSGLFFNELFGAFGTHPALGNLYWFRRREEMLERLRDLAGDGAADPESLADYEQVLANREDDATLIGYFTRTIQFHEQINAYARQFGKIPLLRPSLGCEPDVAGLVTKRLAGKKIVAIHMRLRRLDVGYGGERTYSRDSNFLEWYEFLHEAGNKHPDVQFVTLGRLQEKPLEMLRLPNVMSLRTLGLGLAHELTLMLKSDLFIGTSSGFAAMAYFSELPYFMTNMNPGACKAYCIEYGAERMPFASDHQRLIYEPETRELLMSLLERGLEGAPTHGGPSAPAMDPAIDVRSWEWERSRWLHPHATTSRFFTDDNYSDKETAFLIWPKIKEVRAAWRKGHTDHAWAILDRAEASFPRMCAKFPEFLQLRVALATERNDTEALRRCQASLGRLSLQGKGRARLTRLLRRYLAAGMPFAAELKHAWNRKHRVPRKLAETLKRLAPRRGRS